MYQASGITLEKNLHWSCVEKGGHSTSKVQARKPSPGREGQLTDRTVNKLQFYYGFTVRGNVENLARMKKKNKNKKKNSHSYQSCTVLQASPTPLAAQVGASTSKIKQTGQVSINMNLAFLWKLLLTLNQSMSD